MRPRSPLPPLLCALFATALPTLPAQTDNSVTATVVVLYAASEASPNDLVTPILREPEVEAAVRKIVGDRLRAYRGIGTDVRPATAGRCQVTFTVNLEGTEAWPQATLDAIVDAAFAHLRGRMVRLLHDEPLRLLLERRDECLREREEHLREHAALQQRWDAIDAEVAQSRARAAELDQQRLAVQIDLATEQRAHEFLERRCEELLAQREARREHKQKIVLLRPQDDPDRNLLDLRLTKLGSTTPTTKEQVAEIEQLREQLRALNAKFSAHARELDAANEQLADVQDQLTRCLEQLPTSTLALQRARARLEAIDAVQQQLDKRLASALAQRDQLLPQLARAGQLQLDLEVGRSVLAELHGRLARLEPVRCELLR
jgi:DNA repair ATPase RecN